MSHAPESTLINGVRFSGEAAPHLSLDLSDPLAVLALKLVADGTGAVRQRAAARTKLLQRVDTLAGKGASAALQRPEAAPRQSSRTWPLRMWSAPSCIP